MLCELDHTVYEIRKGFNFKTVNKDITTRIEDFQEKKDPILLTKNCYFGNYDRTALFKEDSSCYELRVLGRNVFEAYYLTKGIDDDGKFNEEALKPGGQGQT